MSYVCKRHDEFVPDGQQCRWCEPAEESKPDAALHKIDELKGGWPWGRGPAAKALEEVHGLKFLGFDILVDPSLDLACRIGGIPATYQKPAVPAVPVLDQRNAEPVALGAHFCPLCLDQQTQWRVFWIPKGKTLFTEVLRMQTAAREAHDKVCPGLIQAKDTAGWPLRDGPEGA